MKTDNRTKYCYVCRRFIKIVTNTIPLEIECKDCQDTRDKQSVLRMASWTA